MSESYNLKSVKVTKEHENIRLDKWLSSKIKNLSFQTVQKLIRKGKIVADSSKVRSSLKLKIGMIIGIPDGLLLEEKKTKSQKLPDFLIKDIRQRVLYEDDQLIGINKPYGLAVQGGTGIDYHLNSLFSVLNKSNNDQLKLVHRLDKNTSGVIIVAKNKTSAKNLTAMFKSEKIKKSYWAIVIGRPIKDKGIIDLPISKRLVAKKEMMVVSNDGNSNASTVYKIKESNNHYSWIELNPITGRTHQLRVHCAAIGIPILGDKKYGNNENIFFKGCLKKQSKMHLFSRSITIPDDNRNSLEIIAPVPDHMKKTFELLNFHYTRDENKER